MTTALGVAPVDGVGVDPLTHRRIIRALWQNPGILTGLQVSGRADLRYDVSAGAAVCTRGEADGYTIAYWPGGQTPAVKAGDPSLPRIDRIWIRSNDRTQKDATNQVEIGVTQGTPAATPSAPATPVGCMRIIDMMIPAGATSTGGATKPHSADYALPYGACGALLTYGKGASTQEYQIVRDGQWHKVIEVDFRIPTDRTVNVRWKGRASTKSETQASYFIQLKIDGTVINDPSHKVDWIVGQFDEIGAGRFAETKTLDIDYIVSTPGTHTAEAWVTGNTHTDSDVWLVGNHVLSVTDRGVFR